MAEPCEHNGRVVLVHGRAASMETPVPFEAEWVAAARYGLKRVEYEHWECVRISMPFYGGIWRPDDLVDPPVFDPGRGRGEGVEVTFDLPDFGRAIEGFFEWVDRRTGGSGLVLDWILNDTREYLEKRDLRERTDQEAIDACQGDAEPVLVGFSMGSLVAYHLLVHASKDFRVKSFISCGSPMGDRAFRDRLARISPDGKLSFPGCLLMWANIWNDDDPATQEFELSKHYERKGKGRGVQAQETRGREPGALNPAAAHNPLDYLSSKALGSALKTALEAAGSTM